MNNEGYVDADGRFVVEQVLWVSGNDIADVRSDEMTEPEGYYGRWVG
jgi:hypothetical protein